MDREKLLENHIHFLSKHRGERKSIKDVEYINSTKAEFNIAFPQSADAVKRVGNEHKIYLPYWIVEDVPGRKNAGGVAYMNFPGTPEKSADNSSIIIKKAASIQEIEDFSRVQGKGFCDTQEEFDEWHPWMCEQNLKNFGDPNQIFYIAYVDGKPAGVCLTINHKNILGIYAVATIPENRKQGISNRVMSSVFEDVAKSGTDAITLQVEADSYAHNFYKKLGFENAFTCRVFVIEK